MDGSSHIANWTLLCPLQLHQGRPRYTLVGLRADNRRKVRLSPANPVNLHDYVCYGNPAGLWPDWNADVPDLVEIAPEIMAVLNRLRDSSPA